MAHDRPPDPARGVFTTALVVEGAPVALDAHLARLAASVRALYGAELPRSAAALAHERAHGVARGRLRLTATPREASELHLEATVAPLDRAPDVGRADVALALRSVPGERWPGAHKWADRRLLDALDARAAPAGALLLGPDGSVRETTRGNVFALGVDGVLRTPPADGTILPGVTRAQVVALAAAAGVVVREERLARADVQCAREAFATGAVRGIEPIGSLDDRPIGAGHELATRLARELERRRLGLLDPVR